MVIFHGYVKLPEGNMKTLHDPAISLGLEDHVVLCLVIRQGQTVWEMDGNIIRRSTLW